MIMSPLRCPGHVSMEAGDFPEHTADAQRLPLDPGGVASQPVLTPKAWLPPVPRRPPEPHLSVILRWVSVPCHPGPPITPSLCLALNF